MAITPPRIYTKLLAKGEKTWDSEEKEIMRTLGKTDIKNSGESFWGTLSYLCFLNFLK